MDLPVMCKITPQTHDPVTHVAIFMIVPLTRDYISLIKNSFVHERYSKVIWQDGRVSHTYVK